MKTTLLITAIYTVLATPVVCLQASENGERSLAEAVRDFNATAKGNATGRTQPELTEDEVVAAIIIWERKLWKASDEIYDAAQKIATTKILPPNAKLSSRSGGRFNGYNVKCWTVVLEISLPNGKGYGYPIRDQRISCTPLIKNDGLGTLKEIPGSRKN
jgi:hypothetical protein